MSAATDTYKQEHGSKNCMQCAVAYTLGLPLVDVPDFERAGAHAWEDFYKFFADRGFTAEMFPPTVEIDGDYLASGPTARGTNHMVVMRGGELLHDPHPSNAGLESVQVVWLITRRAEPITRSATAAQQPLTDEQKAVLRECRNQAMKWAAQAGIPECGAFGGIAQDLDWLCGQLGIAGSEKGGAA